MAQSCRRLLIAVTLAVTAHVSAQEIRTAERYLGYYFPDGCAGWTADPASGVPSSVTVKIVDFDDWLPPGSIVRKATIDWNLGNDHQYSWQGIPTVSFSLNGELIGPPQTIYNYDACYPPGTLPYTFATADYPNGVPGYVYANPTGKVNSIFLNLANGALMPVGTMKLTLTFQVPDRVLFNVTKAFPEADRRIILSNARSEYLYPYFQWAGGQDGAVPMWVRTRDTNFNFAGGITVYLRVADPPDPSPYSNLPGMVIAHPRDNLGGLATLDGFGLTPDPSNANLYSAVSDRDGYVSFRLKLSNAAGGDNYQVEASLDPTFSSAVWRSAPMTAWKRIFIDKRRMLRNGIFIAQAAHKKDTTIVVRGDQYGGNQGRRRLHPGDHIVLVHSPLMNRTDSASGWQMEFHTIADVQAVSGTDDFQITLGTKSGKTIFTEQLSNDFNRDTAPNGALVGDAIAYVDTLTLTPNDYYDTEDLLLRQFDIVTNEPLSAFTQAFLEYFVLPDSSLATGRLIPIPHLVTDDEATLQALMDRWSPSVDSSHHPPPNYQLLAIADRPDTDARVGITTISVAGERASFVLRGRIEDETKGGAAPHGKQNPARWAEKTEAHELAHQFLPDSGWITVPGSKAADKYHCPPTATVFDNPAVYCLLASPSSTGSETQSDNMLARFHVMWLPTQTRYDSEYFDIRIWDDPYKP